MKRDLISLRDYSAEEILSILDEADRLKKERIRKRESPKRNLAQRTIVLIFEKPSLRTRVTFEIAMNDLRGSALYLSPESIQIGKRESVKDIALNLERWADGIVARTFSQKTIEDLARYARVPVINALSDLYHPCQALAFGQALREHKGHLKGLNAVFAGDGNNVCHSIMILCAKLGMNFTLAHPEGYGPSPEIHAAALSLAGDSGAIITLTRDLKAAVRNADVIYTDTWTSMGQEVEAERRKLTFAPYQVNSALLAGAPKECLVSHCLPAHRGLEITDEVLDASMAYDEAENRLHVQKAILLKLLEGNS